MLDYKFLVNFLLSKFWGVYFISAAYSRETDISAPEWQVRNGVSNNYNCQITKSWNWTAVFGHPYDHIPIM